MGSDVMSGFGAERDQALRVGGREQVRSFNSGIRQERTLLPLGERVRHQDLRKGNFCSFHKGGVVPFDHALGFGGVIESIAEESNQGYMASVIIRAAMLVWLSDLSKGTPLRSKVYALAGPQSETCSLAETGAAFGELLSVENLQERLVIVGFKPADDARPLEFSGRAA